MGAVDRSSTSRSARAVAEMRSRPVMTETHSTRPRGSSSTQSTLNADTVDIQHVHELDQMAPQSLLQPPPGVKRESSPPIKTDTDEPVDGDVNTAQALDLSESEDEDHEELMASHFASTVQDGETDGQLFLFQFPHTFPEFRPRPSSDAASTDTKESGDIVEVPPSEVKAESSSESVSPAEGQIGHLDIYADGRVMLRLGDIPFDVMSGSETSFLQEVMILDPERQEAQCLGELNSKLVVTPSLEHFMAQLSTQR